MKIYRTIAVAIATAFIALTSPFTADAARKTDGKNKAQLKVENEILKIKLDSLKAELTKYQIELQKTDSIANEHLTCCITPQEPETPAIEYTTEVSDSLLHIWYVQKQLSEEELDMEGTDTAIFKSNVPDSVYIQ